MKEKMENKNEEIFEELDEKLEEEFDEEIFDEDIEMEFNKQFEEAEKQNAEKINTVQPPTGEKKSSLVSLVEKGKISGKLTSQEIDNALIDLDLSIEELEQFYETIENQMVEAAKKYVAENISSISNGTIITLDTLINSGYLKDVKNPGYFI